MKRFIIVIQAFLLSMTITAMFTGFWVVVAYIINGTFSTSVPLMTVFWVALTLGGMGGIFCFLVILTSIFRY